MSAYEPTDSGEFMKFTKTKLSGLTGNIEDTFTCEQKEPGFDEFRIIASVQGIQFQGRSPFIGSPEELEVLAKTVSDAWRAHQIQMRSKLVTT